MKLFDLYMRILKKQVWLYSIYLGIFFLFLFLAADIGGKNNQTIFIYYRYAVLVLMVLVMLTISAVTSVTSDTELFMRHQAAPVRTELLALTYLGADLLVMLFWWMLFFWTAVVLYGEAAYNIQGLFMAANLLMISLFSTALGFIIGIFSKSAQGRGIAANLMAFALPFVGGSIEVANWGDYTVYLLRSFTPVFWYQKTLDEIILKEGGKLENVIAYMGIQVMFAIMVLTLGMMLDKQRRNVN